MRNLNTKGLNAPRAMVMALFLLLACFVAGRTAVTAEAASNKVTVLKQGKTYSFNLNGGKKKEKVRYTFNDFIGYIPGEFKLYINGKKVYSSSGWYERTEVQLLDVVRKDKYKELLISCMSVNSCLEKVVLVRYLSGKKIKVFDCDYAAEHLGKCPTIVKNSGKNKFYVVSDTPFHSAAFGRYCIGIPLKLQGNRLVFANTDSAYDMVPQDQPDPYRKFKYTLTRSMTLYSSASRTKQLGTLPSGTSFTASKIRPAGSKIVPGNDNAKVKYYDLFVKIKTASGRTGWLFFPGYPYAHYLKYMPMWGG